MSSITWIRKKARSDPRVLAAEMADKGAEEGTVLVKGGSSQPSLDFSVILRPGRNPAPGMLAVIATLCASEGIRKDTGIITWIRWPDEVVTEGRAVAKTSVTTGGPNAAPWAIMNFSVYLRRMNKPGTTSLEELLGVTVNPIMLVDRIIGSLSRLHLGWVRGMRAQILERVGSSLEVAEGKVTVSYKGKVTLAIVRGVDEKGRLIVQIDDSGTSAVVEGGSALLQF